MHPRLDDSLATTLRREAALDCFENFIILKRQGLDVEAIQKSY